MRRVQSRDNGGAKDGGAERRSTRGAPTEANIAWEADAGSNATCTGATIWAEDSPNAGGGTLRWQQGASGELDDPCGRAAVQP